MDVVVVVVVVVIVVVVVMYFIILSFKLLALESWHNGANVLSHMSLVMDEEWMRPVDVFPGLGQYFDTVGWVTGRTLPQKFCHLSPSVLFESKQRKNLQRELAGV